jgi:hypothetical protein
LPIESAVNWAWAKFGASTDAQVLDPEEQIATALRLWIATRWDVTIKDTARGRDNNREAEGWYDEMAVYIPTASIAKAVGGSLKEENIARVLLNRGLIAKRPSDKRIAVRYVPKFGHVNCYALRRELFGRNERDMDANLHLVNPHG